MGKAAAQWQNQTMGFQLPPTSHACGGGREGGREGKRAPTDADFVRRCPLCKQRRGRAGLTGGRGSGIERKPTVRKTELKGCGGVVRCGAEGDPSLTPSDLFIVDVNRRARSEERACIILFDEPDLLLIPV